MPRRRVLAVLAPALLFLAGCSDGRNASLSVRLTYPQDGTAAAPAQAPASADGAARPLGGGTAAPAYVKADSNRILIRVLAPHLPAPMEAWFDRSAGRGEIAGIPPGDRIAVEVDEYDATETTLLGRGWAQGVPLAPGEHKTVAIPMYDKGTIVRVCGAAPAAGAGTPGDSGDGGLAIDALLGQPLAVATGPGDEIFVSSAMYDRVRKIDRYGYITHYAGNGPHGTLIEGAPATTSPIGGVYDLDIDASGNLYLITKWQEVVRVDSATGIISIKYGGEPFNAVAEPNLAVADDNTIFYTNVIDDNIYLVRDGIRSAFVVDNMSLTLATEPEPALPMSSVLKAPAAVTYDSGGTVLVYCSRDSNRIKSLNRTLNLIFNFVGSATASPSTADNIVSTDMEPQYPSLVEYDRFGKMRYFFAEEGLNTIRSVRLDVWPNTVWTLAGNGTLGYSGDGGPATAAQLRNPRAVTTDSRGNVYIADTGNHAIRMVVGGALP